MPIFGRIRPKVIARMIRMAVVPSAITPKSKSGDAFPPSAIRPTNPPAIRNRNTPGIRDTTEAKAEAAKDSRSRSAIGVMIDEFLAAERMHDRRLQELGKREHLVVGTDAAGATEQSDAAGVVE